MLAQMRLRDRMFLLTFVLLIGVVGGLVAFYVMIKFYVGNNFNYVEKVTEKQVYLENSSKIESVKKVSQSLVTAVEADRVDDYLKLKGDYRAGCFEVNSSKCGINGVIISSDGLVVLPLASLGNDFLKKNWVIFDNNSVQFDVQFLAEDQSLGLELVKLMKRGDKVVAESARTKLYGFKTLPFSDWQTLVVGQEVLLLNNNPFVTLANAKDSMIGSLLTEKLLMGSSAVLNMDEQVRSLKLTDDNFANGLLVSDLGGQLLAITSQKNNGAKILVSARDISSLISKYGQNKSWKEVNWGGKYSLNNKDRQNSLGFPVDYGVIVEELIGDSVLAKNVGLKVGDLILSVDGESLLSESLENLLSKKIVGQKISISVLRAGKKIDLQGSL